MWAVVMLCITVASHATAATQETYRLDDSAEGEGGWQLQKAPAPGTPEAELQQVRRLIAQGEAKKAQDAVEAWMKRHPSDPLTVEARLLRGDAKVQRGLYYKALYDYEYIARFYPGTQQFQTALEREFEIARLFTGGTNRKFLGLRLLPADGEGEELFIRIQERAPGSEIGERAVLELADYYFRKGEMIEAAEAYDLFLQNYPRSERREWAMLRLIQASLARFNGPEFDASTLLEAGERLDQYESEFPAAAERIGASGLQVRIRESLAARDYSNARWYQRRGERVSAAFLFRRLVEQYPQTAAAGRALERLKEIDVPAVAPLGYAGRGGAGEGAADEDAPDDAEPVGDGQ